MSKRELFLGPYVLTGLGDAVCGRLTSKLEIVELSMCTNLWETSAVRFVSVAQTNNGASCVTISVELSMCTNLWEALAVRFVSVARFLRDSQCGASCVTVWSFLRDTQWI